MLFPAAKWLEPSAWVTRRPHSPRLPTRRACRPNWTSRVPFLFPKHKVLLSVCTAPIPVTCTTGLTGSRTLNRVPMSRKMPEVSSCLPSTTIPRRNILSRSSCLIFITCGRRNTQAAIRWTSHSGKTNRWLSFPTIMSLPRSCRYGQEWG